MIGHCSAATPQATAPEGWIEYERRKQAWLAEHPQADGAEIAIAMRGIADDLGL